MRSRWAGKGLPKTRDVCYSLTAFTSLHRMKRSFHLGQSDFDSLLSLLSSDREEAGEIYEQLRGGLLRFFHYKGCSDAADLVDETFDRVAVRTAKFDPSLSADPKRYFYGFAVLIAKEHKRKAARLVPLNGREVNDGASSNGAIAGEAQMGLLQDCLKRLDPTDRGLITEYYSREGQARIDLRHRMCDQLNCTATSLYVRTLRIRKRLRACIDSFDKNKM